MVADHQGGGNQGRVGENLTRIAVQPSQRLNEILIKRNRHLAVSLFGVSNNRQCCSDRVNPYWGHPQLYQTCVQYIQVSALASPMRAVRSNASSETSNVKMSWSISI